MAGNDKVVADFTNVLNNLAVAISGLQKPVNEFNREFEETSSVARDLATTLGRIVATSDDLPKGIKKSSDLMKAMLKDEKLFEKIKQKSFKLQTEELDQYWKKRLNLAKLASNLQMKEFKKTKDYKILLEQMGMLRDKERQRLEDQFQDLKNRGEVLKKEKEILVDLKGMWEKVGEGIRNPSKMIDGAIGKMSQGAGSLISSLMKLSGVAGGLFAVGAGLLVGGVMLAVAAFTQMFNFLDKKVMPATAAFNKQIGNMGQSTAALKQETMSMGVRFEMLGMSFGEGAQAARDFAGAMMLVGKSSKKEMQDTIMTGVKLTHMVGLSAEAAGKLALMFEKGEGSLHGVNDSMKQASQIAHDYQVPVNQIRRDMGDNIDLLARFGTKNRMVMLESAAQARTYGLSIKEVNAAFGKQLDTFEGTSNVAAKLNAVFGTHINSYKLMLETNPVKRMEMLRGELLKQGKTWDSLDTFEKNVITSTMGVSEQQAALALSSDDVRKKLQAQAAQQAKQNKVQQDWDKGLSNIKETLIAWEPLLDRLLRSVAQFISKLFGFGDAGDATAKTAAIVEQAIGDLTGGIDNATKNINVFKETWDSIFSPTSTANAEKAVKLLSGDLNKITLEQKRELGNILQDEEQRVIAKRKLVMYEGMTADQAERYLKAYEGFSASGADADALASGDLQRDKQRRRMTGVGFSAKDALVTKRGEVINFHPDDNILATKSPVARSGAGATASAGKGSGGRSETIVIQPAPIYLDGKKIAEVLFRESRR